ncbi:MAG: 4-hydroxy-2-oxovalerate aldolase [Anaerolineae bacterium]|nr:4-hydroxy-2-oxovalerate aldolase [Anaerolineae bacterium]
MRNSKILAKLRAGKAARIAHTTHYFPAFIAVAAHNSYDGVWIDLEHNPMDGRELQALLAFCHLYDIDAMVRPPSKDKTRLYRLLEDGATGLFVQHVRTVDEVRALVDATKFPPIGDRGMGGFGLDANFTLDIKDSIGDLVENARETFLFVQIETPEALANVDKIAALPGVDGLYIGPVDLGLRLKHKSGDQHPDMAEVMGRVAEAARTHGIAWGSYPTDFAQIEAQAALGARILIWGGDIALIKSGLAAASDALAGVLGEE